MTIDRPAPDGGPPNGTAEQQNAAGTAVNGAAVVGGSAPCQFLRCRRCTAKLGQLVVNADGWRVVLLPNGKIVKEGPITCDLCGRVRRYKAHRAARRAIEFPSPRSNSTA